MKLTKERLVQIIKEELELSEITNDADGDAMVGHAPTTNTEPPQKRGPTKQEFARELIRVARDEITRSKGLDSGEVIVLDNIFGRLLQMAEEGSTASTLKTFAKRIPDGQ